MSANPHYSIMIRTKFVLVKNFLSIIIILFTFTAYGQLEDGSIAPDFTLTDFYGTEHTLYDYLDEGKTVFVEIFAAHCTSCWSYHQTDILKNIYNQYGPDGSDELMVLALEHDDWNGHDEFKGIGDPWNTAGNWLDGTPYPLFNVEGADRIVFEEYNVNWYPVIYKVCPDRLTERVFQSWDEETLYEKVQQCQKALSVEEPKELGEIYFDNTSGNLVIQKFEDIQLIRVLNLRGQVLQSIQTVSSSIIPIDNLSQGIYLFEIRSRNTVLTRKFYID